MFYYFHLPIAIKHTYTATFVFDESEEGCMHGGAVVDPLSIPDAQNCLYPFEKIMATVVGMAVKVNG